MRVALCNITAFTLATLCLASTASAQWPDDAAANLAVADPSGDQVQNKVTARPGGGYYVSWFDNRSGGYDVYLQYFDAQGVAQLADDGVLVADRSFSSTQDYGLGVDTSGNALLVFRDDRAGDTQITASKVGLDGSLLWGSDGVQLTAGSQFYAAPKIVGTTDGEVMVAWKADNDVNLMRLDGGGAPVFANDLTITDAGGRGYSASDMQAGEAGSVIVSVVFEPSGFLGPKHLYAQKFSDTGAALWGVTPLAVYDSGSLQFGNFPRFVSDGNGGAVFSWYNTAGELQVYAQHVLANGTEAYPHNGAAVSTALRERVSPDVAFDATTGSAYVVYRDELPGGNPQYAVFAQRLNATGVRQWGDEGVVVSPLTTTEVGFPRVVHQNGGASIFWIRTNAFNDQTIHASRLDIDGNAVWMPGTLDVATTTSAKSRPWASGGPDAFALLAWSDNRNGNDDIYIQNINNDGTLGNAIDDEDGDGVEDGSDNCIQAANADQRDSNADGFGNVCDGDLNNDCDVNFIDLGIMKSVFFSNDADADLEGDGDVNFIDLGLMKQGFFTAPGPSGLPNSCDGA